MAGGEERSALLASAEIDGVVVAVTEAWRSVSLPRYLQRGSGRLHGRLFVVLQTAQVLVPTLFVFRSRSSRLGPGEQSDEASLLVSVWLDLTTHQGFIPPSIFEKSVPICV
jgi:hypothetical protein